MNEKHFTYVTFNPQHSKREKAKFNFAILSSPGHSLLEVRDDLRVVVLLAPHDGVL